MISALELVLSGRSDPFIVTFGFGSPISPRRALPRGTAVHHELSGIDSLNWFVVLTVVVQTLGWFRG